MQLADLTLILPTRNEARNIARFLESVPAELQLIVIDDSRDETPILIETLRPERTLLLREPGSVTRARQCAAGLARTRWLLFSDADVVFAPDYFERLSLLSGSAAYYGPKLSADRFRSYYRGIAIAQAASHACGIPAASGSNLLIRRDALESVGGFDLDLTCNEDSEVVWRLRRAGYRVSFRKDLVVQATDHRRLEAGRLRKTLHSMTRCALLYTNLMPRKYRTHDWGYWQQRDG
jgi:glycosyltransferase involved in cell wall biosynthesis